MFTTLNMGLTAWDLGDDPYDHSQLANNWVEVDNHNHTPGSGVQIPSEGLRDRSVTETKIALQAVDTPELADDAVHASKLADNSVNASKIVDGSVGTSEIANGAVTAAKLDPTILEVGSIIMWGRSDQMPTGGIWEICDGRPWSTVSNTMGYTTGNMPDFRNSFPLGAATTGTGSGTGTPPAVAQEGGSHTTDLTHTHTGGAHTHPVPDHTHAIASVGNHNHAFPDDDGVPTDAFTRLVGVVTSIGTREALYVPGLHSDGTGSGSSHSARMTYGGGHDHGGVTGGASGLTSGSAGAVTTSGASRDLSAVDKRPAYTGVLFIMRVR